MKSIDKFVLVLVASLALLLAGCGGGSSTPEGPTEAELAEMRAMEMRAAEQRTALEEAHTALEAALGALVGANTQDQIDAASAAHQGLVDAIAAAADVSDTSMYQTAADDAMSTITTAQTRYDERVAAEMAEADRIAEEEAAAEAERQRMEAERIAAEEAAAMAVLASKLHAGISIHNATDNVRTAVYNNNDIDVTIGTNAAVTLSEDEDATVAARHGWVGQMFTAEPDGDGTYEAVVYSNVGESTEGAKFNDAANGGYALNADTGETADVTTLTGHASSRVALPSVTRTAGTETFELPMNTVRVIIGGSYQGVAGTYYCTPTGGGTDCSAAVAENGFTLGGGTWTFKPSNPETRLMDQPDAIYASYGWWIHKSEDGDTFTASAFAANKGAVPAASGITALMGTATYRGGAAGKYALHSSTGGTNDAGHFTANAMLQANFNDDTVSGTIDGFMGADGEARDWSVELMESTVSDDGAIAGDPDTTGNTDAQMTAWTIGGTAGDAAGEWSGNLYENGDDLVPGVATGTFYSTFGRDGKMVGAFGANKDD